MRVTISIYIYMYILGWALRSTPGPYKPVRSQIFSSLDDLGGDTHPQRMSSDSLGRFSPCRERSLPIATDREDGELVARPIDLGQHAQETILNYISGLIHFA